MGRAPRLLLHADPHAGILGLEGAQKRLHVLRLGAHRPEVEHDLAAARALAAPAEDDGEEREEENRE